VQLLEGRWHGAWTVAARNDLKDRQVVGASNRRHRKHCFPWTVAVILVPAEGGTGTVPARNRSGDLSPGQMSIEGGSQEAGRWLKTCAAA
jgi:hypothetical protein